MTYPDVQSFDSFEEMQDHLRARVENARSMIQDHQRPMLDGKEHHWLRILGFSASNFLLIAGVTVDLESHVRDLAAKYPEEVDYAEELESMRANLANGFLTGNAFSEWEPTGEWGDTHVSTVIEIDLVTFFILLDMGWSLEKAKADPHTRAALHRWVEQVSYQ